MKGFSQDPNARSLSFYATGGTVVVGRELLREMYAESCSRGSANLRVCLHPSADHSFHQMVILEWRGRSFPAHRHPTKSESYHLLSGEMDVLIYDTDGTVRSRTRLDKDNPIMRVGPEDFHGIEVVSEHVIYHEVKPGPFVRASDKEMAPWLKS